MNIRTIGYIIGEDDKAEALVQHMEHDMAQGASQHSTRRAVCARDVVRTRRLYRGGAHDVR